jgi:hypothetical protein
MCRLLSRNLQTDHSARLCMRAQSVRVLLGVVFQCNLNISVICERYPCVILLMHVSVFTATNLKLIAVTLSIKPKLAPPTAQTSRATVCSLEQPCDPVKS